MTVTDWTYITMKDSNVRIGWDGWTAFKFQDGSYVIIGCQIPREKIKEYIRSKGWH